LQTPQFLILATAKLPFIIKGIDTAGQALDQPQIRDLRPQIRDLRRLRRLPRQAAGY
jgi:hypothetical protein